MTTTPETGLSAALAGRYVLERELGGGGMSRVFIARELASAAPWCSRCCPMTRSPA